MADEQDTVLKILAQQYDAGLRSFLEGMKSIPTIAEEMPPEELEEFLCNLNTGFAREELQFLHALHPIYIKLLENLPLEHPPEYDHLLEGMVARLKVINEITPLAWEPRLQEAVEYYQQWRKKLWSLPLQCHHADEPRQYDDVSVAALVQDAYSLGREVRWLSTAEYTATKLRLEERLLPFFYNIRKSYSRSETDKDVAQFFIDHLKKEPGLQEIFRREPLPWEQIDYTLIPFMVINGQHNDQHNDQQNGQQNGQHPVYFLRDKNNNLNPFTMMDLGDFQICVSSSGIGHNSYFLELENGVRQKKEFSELPEFGF